MALRIVAGALRGRRLNSPDGQHVRPTSDRVRESIFNSLDSSGLIRDAVVLDLFAGSGALGLEALSRGAARVDFVDSSTKSLRTLRSNIEVCSLGERSSVTQADAIDFVRSSGCTYDLALLDPPYDFDNWRGLLDHLKSAAVVIESDRRVLDAEGVLADDVGLSVSRERRYGGTVVTFAKSKRRDDHDGEVPEGR